MSRRKPAGPPIDMEALARTETVARLRLLADVRVQLVDLRREIKEAEARCKDLGEDMAVFAELKALDRERYRDLMTVARAVVDACHDRRQTTTTGPVKETAAKVAAERWGVSGSVVR